MPRRYKDQNTHNGGTKSPNERSNWRFDCSGGAKIQTEKMVYVACDHDPCERSETSSASRLEFRFVPCWLCLNTHWPCVPSLWVVVSGSTGITFLLRSAGSFRLAVDELRLQGCYLALPIVLQQWQTCHSTLLDQDRRMGRTVLTLKLMGCHGRAADGVENKGSCRLKTKCRRLLPEQGLVSIENQM